MNTCSQRTGMVIIAAHIPKKSSQSNTASRGSVHPDAVRGELVLPATNTSYLHVWTEYSPQGTRFQGTAKAQLLQQSLFMSANLTMSHAVRTEKTFTSAGQKAFNISKLELRSNLSPLQGVPEANIVQLGHILHSHIYRRLFS